MAETRVGGVTGPLAHVDLWSSLWEQCVLYGDSVTVQWVPSRVGVQGNERADEGAVRGSARAFADVVRDRKVCQFGQIWDYRKWRTPVMTT